MNLHLANSHLVGESNPFVTKVLRQLLNQVDIVRPSRRARHGEDNGSQHLLLVIPRTWVERHARAPDVDAPVRHNLGHSPTSRSNEQLKHSGRE